MENCHFRSCPASRLGVKLPSTPRVGGGSALAVRPHHHGYFMASENILPNELVAVARSLEQQSRQLGLSNRTIPLAEWDSLSPKVRGMIPGWLMKLLSSHSLAGLALERPHEHGTWDRYFGFWTPSAYAQRVTPDDPGARNGWWLTEEMIQDGFIPLSDESDGDMWLTSITGTPLSPVYLYDLSAGERKVAGDSMAGFLASFQICKN